MALIAPSVLAADFALLSDQIQTAEQAGADWFHLDVMDGHFVPNISFGPVVVETVRQITERPLDVHLMIDNPDAYIRDFRDAGADVISVHVETCPHLHRTVNLIKEVGAKAGVALNPATSATLIEDILAEADLILVMSVNPGFGGQKFIEHALMKTELISRKIRNSGRKVYLEIDGGIDKHTAPKAVAAGADVLVAGSAIFGATDIAKALEEMRAAIKNQSYPTV